MPYEYDEDVRDPQRLVLIHMPRSFPLAHVSLYNIVLKKRTKNYELLTVQRRSNSKVATAAVCHISY